MQVLSDLALARRLERSEAVANARFVEAHARAAPESGFEWMEVAGAYAMYDGPNSPCTQTFGLGLFEQPAEADMNHIETFFKDRGAPVHHEVSPMAGVSIFRLLSDRGYRPVELSSVMFLPLNARSGPAAHRDKPVSVRLAGPGEQDLWVRTALAGWREFPAAEDAIAGFFRTMSAKKDPLCFLAEIDSQPVATGSLEIHDGVGLLAGASTVPEYRHRGAQAALLDARLEYAGNRGCDLAMICAEAGSSSQRNAERQGFRIAYTRTKWML
jgi:GNAT superfamily N-acetyltransferase